MVEDLMRDFAVGAALLGNLSAFYFYAYASIQIPVGLMMDRFGPRRLLTVSAFVCALGCALFAVADDIWLAYLGRSMIGAGAAFAFVGTLTISMHWFPASQFALLTGLLQMFGMIGAVGGQAPTAILIDQIGWRLATLAGASSLALVAVLIWWVVQDKPGRASANNIMSGLSLVLRNPQTWICSAIGMSAAGSMLAFAGLWGVPFLTSVYDIDRTTAASMLSVFFIGWGVIGPVIGWMSDRVGRRKPFLQAGTLMVSVIMFFIIQTPDVSMVTLSALFFLCGGAGSGMILTYASAKELNHANAGGAAMGVVNMAVVGSGALMQPVIGLLLDWNWQGQIADGVRFYSENAYQKSLIVLPIAAGIGFLLSLFLKESFGNNG